MDGESTKSAVDLIQEYLEVTGMTFHRQDVELLTFEYDGTWGTHKFVVAEKPHMMCLIIQCHLKFTVPKKFGGEKEKKQKLPLSLALTRLRELFDRIHSAVPQGTFHSVLSVKRLVTVVWSCRLPLSSPCDEEMLEDSLNEALDEIDEFFPAVRLVLSGMVTAQEAYDSAIPESYGRA